MINRGFTIIELVVAIFILVVGATAAFTLIHNTLTFSKISSYQLTAAYLAQEGIEIIRNVRDNNWLKQRTNPELTWDGGLSAVADFRLDYQSTNFPGSNCSLGPENYLKYDGNFFNCSAGNETKFKRKITITKPEASILNISVEVSFQERGRTHQIMAQEKLYQWR